MQRCPGQDMRYWVPEDISDIKCPICKTEIEIWKDEPFRLCPVCQAEIKNPNIDLGCAEWCKFGHLCKGQNDISEKEKEELHKKAEK